jgi:hypothetical protein
MSLIDRDGASADALLTDLYLDAVLAGAVMEAAVGDGAVVDGPDLDPAARLAADRLRRDLVRVHPSFRFEERLATRLAEAAMTMRVPAAVGAEGRVIPFRAASPLHAEEDVSGPASDGRPRDLARPLIIGGALTSAALSLAGAALVAWRRGRPGTAAGAMGRAARAAHAAGTTATRRRSRRTGRRIATAAARRGSR